MINIRESKIYKMIIKLAILVVMYGVSVGDVSAEATDKKVIYAEEYIRGPAVSSNETTEDIQRAIDEASLSGNTLMFAKAGKTYYIRNTIKLPSNTSIDFNNCVIKRDGAKGVFDMIINNDRVNGNKNITIKNLKIHGNKDVSSLNPVIPNNRFIGMGFYKASKVYLKNIDVSYTVNAEQQPEGNRAGIIFEKCTDVFAKSINGHDNDRTAIMIIDSNVKIDGSLTYSNKGSGISSNSANYSEYYNISTHDNGYSQLSVNGKYSKIDNVKAYNGAKGYSNINIGHNNAKAASHGSIAKNIVSDRAKGWGITISGSDDVTLHNIIVKNSSEFGIFIMDGSARSRLTDIKVSNSEKSGIYYKYGDGHYIDFADIRDNGTTGIMISSNAEVTIDKNVVSCNNGKKKSTGSAGVLVSGIAHILGGRYYNDGNVLTQESGIWVAGGEAEIGNVYFEKNRLFTIRKTGNASVKGIVK